MGNCSSRASTTGAIAAEPRGADPFLFTVELDTERNADGTTRRRRIATDASAASTTTNTTTAMGTRTLSIPVPSGIRRHEAVGSRPYRNRRRRRRSSLDSAGSLSLRDEARMAEIMALQQSLAAMEEFFQSLLGQPASNHHSPLLDAAMDPAGDVLGFAGPPPASEDFRRNLRVRPFRGVVPTVCGVCGESMAEGVQLPCGHRFHLNQCALPWLSRHCTCPVCRYEVETDDESFEPGRIDRMSKRMLPIDQHPHHPDPQQPHLHHHPHHQHQRQCHRQHQHQQQHQSDAPKTDEREPIRLSPSSSSAIGGGNDKNDEDDDHEEEDDIVFDPLGTSTVMDRSAHDNYDADASEPDGDTVQPNLLFSKPHSTSKSHYDADESSLETVDLSRSIGMARSGDRTDSSRVQVE